MLYKLRAAGLRPPVPHDTDAHRCNVFFYSLFACSDEAALAGRPFEEKDRVGVTEIETEFKPSSATLYPTIACPSPISNQPCKVLMVNSLIQSLQRYASYLNAEWVIDGHGRSTHHVFHSCSTTVLADALKIHNAIGRV
ncbi:hypothetical protein CPC08DRAFT_824608 [Agrocybe pediades]|nr:hypothetical protein CPC08DRAFT_824608 [Agrocybe pediades]